MGKNKYHAIDEYEKGQESYKKTGILPEYYLQKSDKKDNPWEDAPITIKPVQSIEDTRKKTK